MFALSTAEVTNPAYGFESSDGKNGIDTDGNYEFYSGSATRKTSSTAYARSGGSTNVYETGTAKWWLRSPANSKWAVRFVDSYGMIDYTGEAVNGSNYRTSVRPAFNLDVSSVFMISVANNGKNNENGIKDIVENSGTEWKLTMTDSSRTFSVESSEQNGQILTIRYTGAKTGNNEYISAVIKNENGEIVSYGRIAPVVSADDTVEIDLSNVEIPKAGKLYVFNEQYNGII